MDGKPVTIRLIDPPLHEFVPKTREQAQALSDATGMDVDHILEPRPNPAYWKTPA